MATAVTANQPAEVWRTRGTWNARDDRLAFAVWLGVLWVGLIVGFGVDFPRFLSQAPPAPQIIVVHAALFTVWMLILTAQVLLVLTNRVLWHRTMGWFAAGWAALMTVVGAWAAMDSQVVHLAHRFIPPPGWLWPTEPAAPAVWFVWLFYGNVLLVAAMLAWDWWRGRMMTQAVIAAVAMVASEIVATALYFWGPWQALTLGWVQWWARL